MKPIKTIHDKKLQYLIALSKCYQTEGYQIKINGRDNILEIYNPKPVGDYL